MRRIFNPRYLPIELKFVCIRLYIYIKDYLRYSADDLFILNNLDYLSWHEELKNLILVLMLPVCELIL